MRLGMNPGFGPLKGAMVYGGSFHFTFPASLAQAGKPRACEVTRLVAGQGGAVGREAPDAAHVAALGRGQVVAAAGVQRHVSGQGVGASVTHPRK